MGKRLEPKLRKREILEAAVKLAAEHGYANVRREAIAMEAGTSTGLVTNYFGTMTNLRRDIMRYAIQNELLPVIAQGIVARDKHAMKAAPELRQRAIDSIR